MSNKDTEIIDTTATSIWEGIERLEAELLGDKPKNPKGLAAVTANGKKPQPMPLVPQIDPQAYINPPEQFYPGVFAEPEQPATEPKRRQVYQRFTAQVFTAPTIEHRYDEGTEDLRQAIANDANAVKAQLTIDEQKQAEAFAAYQSMFLDINNLPAKPPAALRQGDQYLFTLGELFVIAGKAKSRKTFATAGLITAALARSGDPNGLQGALFGNLPSDRPKIHYIDTEQSAYHTGHAFKRAVMLSGERYAQNLYFAHANGKSAAELIYGLNAALSLDKSISVVIIDNGGDLLAAGANDETPSKMLAKELNEIAQRYQIALGVVVHTARTSADDDIGGHFGSQLAQRCAWQARVAVVDPKTKEGRSMSTIEHVRNRWQTPEQGLTFKIEGDLPIIVDYQNAPTARERQLEAATNRGRPPQVDAEDLDLSTHMEIWNDVWSRLSKKTNEPINKADLFARLANALAKWGKGKIGDRRLAKFIAVAIDEGLVVKIGNRFADPKNANNEPGDNAQE